MTRILCVTMAALLSVSLAAEVAWAAEKKGKPTSRNDFTAEQREKLHLQALEACRKAYGPALSRVKVDYRKKRFICYLH